MHNKAHDHNSMFGMTWNPANTAVMVLFALLFLIFLLLFLTLTPQPAAAQAYRLIYVFTANPGNGAGPAFPETGVTMDRSGNIYGATAGNGTIGQQGSVYKLSNSGSGWTLLPLHIFYDGDPDGGLPGAITIAPNGSVYGVTIYGGIGSPPGNGTFFNMRPQPNAPTNVLNAWLDTVLYEFQGGTDSAGPDWALTFDSAGNIYGAACGGGADGAGTVYKLSQSDGQWTEAVLYSFTSGTDGNCPGGGVILDSAGNLYGTTRSGGNASCQYGFGCGVVFGMTRSASGWTETVLYRFQGGGDGGNPSGGLVFDRAGNLYGMTSQGGSNGSGTVYQLSPTGGGWSFNVIYNFQPRSSPSASLIMDTAGNLYGAVGGGLYGNGSIFELTPSGSGWAYRSLYDFPAGGGYGAGPNGPLYIDAQGNLYGTTQNGGSNGCLGIGCGVVFEITP